MLWDLIRDFFVEHVFGGTTSDFITYDGFISQNADDSATFGTQTTKILINGIQNDLGDTMSISMGDWLSTTATAISISIIVVLCCLFVYKIIKLIGGLIR